MKRFMVAFILHLGKLMKKQTMGMDQQSIGTSSVFSVKIMAVEKFILMENSCDVMENLLLMI